MHSGSGSGVRVRTRTENETAEGVTVGQQNHGLDELSQRPALLSRLEQSLYVRACREPRLMGQDLVDVIKVL